jgi:hypothetical protein
MTKSRSTLSVLVVVALAAALSIFFATVDHAATGIPDPCISSSQVPGAGRLLICPAGDGQTLAEIGSVVQVQILDSFGDPIPMVPATDIWLDGCYSGLALCFGSGSSRADHITDANGRTTISGTIQAGGCDNSLIVWVQGVRLVSGPLCAVPECLTVTVRSPDFTEDLLVDLLDLTRFSFSYHQPNFEPCHDITFDGAVDLMDLTLFALHWYHDCYQP